MKKKKINKMKDTTKNEKIEHDKYIKILEENNKELMDKYENINKENEELKSEHINELTELKNKNEDEEQDTENEEKEEESEQEKTYDEIYQKNR